MRILAALHRPTTDLAGAEKMLHAMMRHLAEQGHEVTVITVERLGPASDTVFDGVLNKANTYSKAELAAEVPKYDIVLTHLDATDATLRVGHDTGVPVVIVEHNTFPAHKRFLSRWGGPAGVIYNSVWMAEDWAQSAKGIPSIIVHPPVNPADYVTETGEHVTMINLFKNGSVLWKLANALPQVKFLAVKGGYGRQTIPTSVPRNVTLIDATNNVTTDIYARTRVLLMPSLYESWGRTAIEAASSGIPVIANPVPGLAEALGSAGVFRSVNDLKSWETAILDLLSDSTVYDAYADLARKRAAELWVTTQVQLQQMETFLAGLAS